MIGQENLEKSCEVREKSGSLKNNGCCSLQKFMLNGKAILSGKKFISQ